MKPFRILLLLPLLLVSTMAQAWDVTWKNRFFFYGDNTEFFEPYRTGETLLGQQGKSFFEAGLGPRVFLQAGIFGDFRSTSAVDPVLDLKPILSFQYREGGTRLILGTLETKDRHGFLEPLAVTTLDITRPVEYGFQWLEEDPVFQCDLFLDWHQLNTPTQPEEFDYGGMAREVLSDLFSFEEQFHGFHMGGQLYYLDVYNNWTSALGFRCKAPGLLGTTRLSTFGVMGGHLEGGDTSATQWGGGGYTKLQVAPDDRLEFFGIGWVGKDLYSQEGDANYTSFASSDTSTLDQLHPFVKSDRTYFEIGAQRDFPLEGGTSFRAEFRVHFIDDASAYSYRLTALAPLDLFLFSTQSQREDAKTQSE